jgi:hypothetical protein
MLNPQQFAAKIKAETEVNAEIIKRAKTHPAFQPILRKLLPPA